MCVNFVTNTDVLVGVFVNSSDAHSLAKARCLSIASLESSEEARSPDRMHSRVMLLFPSRGWHTNGSRGAFASVLPAQLQIPLWWLSLCLCPYPCSGGADPGLPDGGRKFVAHGHSLEQL